MEEEEWNSFVWGGVEKGTVSSEFMVKESNRVSVILNGSLCKGQIVRVILNVRENGVECEEE